MGKNRTDNKLVFSDDDFAGKGVMSPPSEKPPPPPPETTGDTGGERRATGEDIDEIDQQEREIIASLEMEEREHNRYIMEQKMRRLPSNLTSNSSQSATVNGGPDSGLGGSVDPAKKPSVLDVKSKTGESVGKPAPPALPSDTTAKNNYNNAQSSQQPSRKRTPNEQKTYNQHWL